MEIREENGKIIVKYSDGGYIDDDSVIAILLYRISEQLENIHCKLSNREPRYGEKK